MASKYFLMFELYVCILRMYMYHRGRLSKKRFGRFETEKVKCTAMTVSISIDFWARA